MEQGDITAIEVCAIVNAANSQLAGGGGVDGAIHHAAGPSVMAELAPLRPCPTGSAVITGAGNLKARYIIHAVGPVYHGGTQGEADLLASCYRKSLELAAERGCECVAFPAISTGVYGYPVEDAARVAFREVKGFLKQPSSIQHVRFVLFSAASLEIHARVL